MNNKKGDMIMKLEFYESLCTYLMMAKAELDKTEGKEIISTGAGFGDLINDTEIQADRTLGEFLRDLFLLENWCHQVTVEGLGTYTEDNQGEYKVYVDPLDNSQGFLANAGTIAFPYSMCVHIMPVGKNKFKDIVAGAVLDLRNGDLFYGEKTEQGCISYLNETQLHPSDELLDVPARKDTIITDFCYIENRKILPFIFSEEKSTIRGCGSAALEMVYPVLDRVALYFCAKQKMHELGAAYIINKGAGRKIYHLWDRKELREYTYNFDEQIPVLIARNENIIGDFFSRLHKIPPEINIF